MMFRRVTAALLLVATTACYGVRPVASPSTFIQTENPEAIWIADDNGEVLELMSPTLKGDSVVGSLDGLDEPVTVELDPENPVYARQKDAFKTATLVGGLGLVAGLAVYGFAVGGGGEKVCNNNAQKPTGRPSC
jgi:hypothetical protein